MLRKSKGRTMVEIKCSLCENLFQRELRRYKEATGKGVDKFYCSKDCMKKRAALPHIQKAYAENGLKRRNNEEIFWSRIDFVDLEDPDTCWEYTGFLEDGYGVFVELGVKYQAQRYAYEKTYGVEIGSLFACHHCDNRACVRPDHIFLGTYYKNMQDMLSKGRQSKGSQIYFAKLDESKVIEIKILLKNKVKLEYIAQKFNVSIWAIKDIKYGSTWKHVSIEGVQEELNV